MKFPFRLPFLAAACALAFSLPAWSQQAPEQPMPSPHSMGAMHGKQMSAEDRQAMAKKHLEREAAALEIKASQQPAWEAYSAAKLDMLSVFGTMGPAKPAVDADAAALARQHADHAAVIAQKLSVLADATAKLQAVLSDDQRKVLNRVSQHPGFAHGGHDFRMCGDRKPGQTPASRSKGQPAGK